MFVQLLQLDSPVSTGAGPVRVCLEIGGVSLGLSASAFMPQLMPDHESFRVPSQSCDIEVSAEFRPKLRVSREKLLFDSGSLWTLHQCGYDFAFDFISLVLGERPYKQMLVNSGFTRARLLLNGECFPDPGAVDPFEYPTDELLTTGWLARGHGVEVHACGLVDAERGAFLFIGHSGAGKSTTTRLWTALRQVNVLSDDRIILRHCNGKLRMYGTPWHGEAGFASPLSSEISRIFILEHGASNEIVPLAASRAVGELFARCFLPFYDPCAIDFTLSFLQQITAKVPCYSYRFLPQPEAVEKALNFHE